MTQQLAGMFCRRWAAYVIGALALTSPASAQVDSARADRIRFAILTDVTLPPQGKYQNQTTRAFFQRLNWSNYEYWMYTDDQRFNTDGTFGPWALITPSDPLDTYGEATFVAAGSNGLVVGAAVVDTAPGATLPESYTGLHLSSGRNCIRISAVGGNWAAYVFPEQAGADPCAMPVPSPPSLRVRRVAATPNAGGSNIPPVARWHEGTRQGKNRMLFGVKCGDHWCIVGPANGVADALPHAGMRNSKQWETHGWHDVQRLAVVNIAGRTIPGRTKASIIAHEKLGDYTLTDFDQDWQPVATIIVHGPLSGRMAKYGRPPSATSRGYWGLLPGDNEMFIRRTTDLVTYPKGWRAQLRHKNAEPFELAVLDWHDHRPKKIPGTARFRWMEHDDGDWVRCDDGCCKIGVF